MILYLVAHQISGRAGDKETYKKYRGHIALYILNQKLCLWKQMSVTKIKKLTDR